MTKSEFEGESESKGREGRLTWMVRAVFPTPPSPSTTSLYKVIFPDMAGREVGSKGGG